MREEGVSGLEVAFTLSREDAAAYYDDWCAYYVRNRLDRRFSLRKLLWQFGWAAAIVGIPRVVAGITGSLAAAGVALLALAFGGVWLAPKVFRWSAVRFMRRDPDLQVEHRMGVSEEGFHDRTDRTQFTVLWPGVKDIAVTERNILFVLEWHHEVKALAVPLRVFADSDRAREFVTLAGNLWKRAARTDPQ